MDGRDEKTILSDRLKQPIDLFLFADRYHVKKLKICLIDAIYLSLMGVERFRLKPEKRALTKELISRVYKNTTTASGLRRLVMAWMIHETPATWYTAPKVSTWLQKWPEIATDLAIAFSQKERQPLLIEVGPDHFYDVD